MKICKKNTRWNMEMCLGLVMKVISKEEGEERLDIFRELEEKIGEISK